MNESFHEHGRHDVLLGMTGRVKQVVTTSWQGQQPDAAPVNRGTLHCDGSIDKEQLTNQMSDAAPVNRGTLHCDGSIDKVQATNPLSQDKKSELGMSKTITSEVGTEGRPIQASVWGQAVGTQSAAGSAHQTAPAAQHVETTGQTNLGAFLDRNLKGAEFERGLVHQLQQCSLEDLQKLAAESNLNPNLEKSALVSIIYRTYVVGSDGESEGGNDSFAKNDVLSGREEASYGRTLDSDVGEEYSALSANPGGQSKGAGTKVRLPSLCSRKKQLRCMSIRQLPRCGFACVVIISRAAKSAVARCPVCQCACMRNPLTSGSIPVAIHLCDSSCFLDCMACYHKKTVAVSEENNMKRWPVGGKLQLEEGCCI